MLWDSPIDIQRASYIKKTNNSIKFVEMLNELYLYKCCLPEI